MTRDELLFSICPMSRVYDCCIADGDYDCDKCKRLTKEWLDEYDKHVIEKYKADTNLKDTIREIHDNVAQEMYCKGIDDLFNEINICRTYDEYVNGINICRKYDEYVNVLDILEIVKKLKEQEK